MNVQSVIMLDVSRCALTQLETSFATLGLALSISGLYTLCLIVKLVHTDGHTLIEN